MLRDYVKKYYLEQRRNCAESLLRAANEAYGLNLTEADFALLSGFGGGMGCGSVCGALTGSLAALGVLYPKTKLAQPDGIKTDNARLVAEFTKALSAVNCDDIKPQRFTEAFRCLDAVLLGADVLEAHIARLNGQEQAPSTCTLTPAQIKEVKALGFLHCKGTNNFNCRVITGNGKLSNAHMRRITEAAEKFGNGEVAMTTRLTMEIQSVPYVNVEPLVADLAKVGLKIGGTGSKVRPVVSCKGTTCQYGLIDTFALSEKLHYLFFEGYNNISLPHKFKLAVGGCPNNCVKPDLNDLGIIGQRAPELDADKCRGCKKCQVEEACPIHSAHVENGKLDFGERCNHCGRCVGKCPFKAVSAGVNGYKIYIGGRWGKQVAQGRALEKIFTSEEEVLAVVEKAILLFREQGITGERFADTVARLGFENVQAQLLSDDLLQRKAQILGLKVVGGASC